MILLTRNQSKWITIDMIFSVSTDKLTFLFKNGCFRYDFFFFRLKYFNETIFSMEK